MEGAKKLELVQNYMLLVRELRARMFADGVQLKVITVTFPGETELSNISVTPEKRA